MNYIQEKKLGVWGSLSSIFSATILIATGIFKFSQILVALGLLGLVAVFSMAVTLALAGLYVFVRLHRRDDLLEIVRSKHILEFDDPDGKKARIIRTRWLKPLVDNLSDIYEGNAQTDGKYESIKTQLFSVPDDDDAARHIDSIDITIPKLANGIHEHLNILELEYDTDPPLKKDQMYKHIVEWQVSNGYTQPEEFYILNVGYLTKRAEIEIRCPKGRIFESKSAKVVQISRQGLKTKSSWPTRYLQQSNDKIYFMLDHPFKGDAFKLSWRWKRVKDNHSNVLDDEDR